MSKSTLTLKDIIDAKSKQDEMDRKEIEFSSGLMTVLSDIYKCQGRIELLLEKILDKPDKEFPEIPKFPDTMQVEMSKPEWYENPPIPEAPDVESIVSKFSKPLVLELRKINSRLGKVVTAKEQVVEVKSTEETVASKPVNTGSLRTRRTVIWVKCSLADGKIIRSSDNLTDFYLPSEPINNSETVRLNGGSPASSGEDYTLIGNLLRFVQDQPLGTTVLEVKYQRK